MDTMTMYTDTSTDTHTRCMIYR